MGSSGGYASHVLCCMTLVFVGAHALDDQDQGVVSCNQLYIRAMMVGVQLNDGVYDLTINGESFPAYCDMTLDGGGWTLLVFATTDRYNNTWSSENIRERNQYNPGIQEEFSILYRGDEIKGQGKGETFEYRIESNDRQSWGGIWKAPQNYSFVSTISSLSNVSLIRKYNDWRYSESSYGKRMPYLGADYRLLTTDNGRGSWWGTLITDRDEYGVAPVVSRVKTDRLYYWLREEQPVPVTCADALQSYPSVSWSGDYFIYSKENNTWDRVKCVHSDGLTVPELAVIFGCVVTAFTIIVIILSMVLVRWRIQLGRSKEGRDNENTSNDRNPQEPTVSFSRDSQISNSSQYLTTEPRYLNVLDLQLNETGTPKDGRHRVHTNADDLYENLQEGSAGRTDSLYTDLVR